MEGRRDSSQPSQYYGNHRVPAGEGCSYSLQCLLLNGLWERCWGKHPRTQDSGESLEGGIAGTSVGRRERRALGPDAAPVRREAWSEGLWNPSGRAGALERGEGMLAFSAGATALPVRTLVTEAI